MRLLWVVLLFGVIAIIFDYIWATVARTKNMSYAKGSWVSFLIYFCAGGFASQNRVLDGLLAGMTVAFVDATVGWWVSWVIGPGRLPDTISKNEYPRRIITTILIVTFLGSLFGLVGAFVF